MSRVKWVDLAMDPPARGPEESRPVVPQIRAKSADITRRLRYDWGALTPTDGVSHQGRNRCPSNCNSKKGGRFLKDRSGGSQTVEVLYLKPKTGKAHDRIAMRRHNVQWVIEMGCWDIGPGTMGDELRVEPKEEALESNNQRRPVRA